MTENGQIGEVQIQSNQILFTDKDSRQIYKTGVMDDPNLVSRLSDSGARFSSEIVEETSPFLSFFLAWILPTLIFFGIGQLISKKMMSKAGGGSGSMMFNTGNHNAKVYVKSSNGITFADVEGEEEAKENLMEIVDYLHTPDKYKEIGASMPKGVLLVGPPGTGKTMLAKAVAGEANVPFFSISGSEFVEMFVGMGAAKVRDLFKQAKEKAPCIVFIDEIDAIGQKRNTAGYGGNDEREQTLNQLLTEMDGFEGNNGVIILAATNRPESLDPALTRPGRFDRRVPVELPDLKGREAILRVHAKKIKVADNVDFKQVARMASGASGAELANIINEAALRAVRDNRSYATQADLEESIEVVIAGYQKKNAILTDKEKWTVAYHEIGHALVAAKQTNSAPVQKITIIPRTSGALGYTMQVEENNHYLMTKEEIENKIATYTGGRAAEEITFGTISTGASNDIEQATKLARAMVTRYGMCQEFDMVAMETVSNQYLGGDTSLACSAEKQAMIDDKVIEIVRRQHEKAVQILMDNHDKLRELAEYLYEKETITGDEFMSILNS
jgi:cell division protease FtsH